MQECWKSKVNWDESISSTLHASWPKFAEKIRLISKLSVERRILIENSTEIQVHGFCDASKVGYGACLYVRSCNSKHTLIRLLCAKVRSEQLLSKKQMSQSQDRNFVQCLQSRLYHEVQTFFTFKRNKVLFWSDQTIVLELLKKSSEVLKIFVANRFKEIQSTCKNIKWHHIQ